MAIQRLSDNVLHGLHDAAKGNAQAFGFSITVTVTFGVLAARQSSPSTSELMVFALSAVATFSLLNLLVAQLVPKHDSASSPGRVVLLSTATDFMAVAAAVGCAVGVRTVLNGLALWCLAPLTAGLAYVLVQSVEFAVARSRSQECD